MLLTVRVAFCLNRSPSPEPIYNNEGKRLNTREYRTRKKLEDDRHAAITRMFELNTEYKPPSDYKWVLEHVTRTPALMFIIAATFLKFGIHLEQPKINWLTTT